MGAERVIVIERRLRLTPRTCAVCGREFPGWGRQRYCGKGCQRRADYERHAEARRAGRRAYYEEQHEHS
jgi:hypothetical protein